MSLLSCLRRAAFTFAFVIVLMLMPWIAPVPARAQAADDGARLLQVTDAFKLSARIDNPGVVQLHWTIAPHYYLYRGRIKARSLAASARLGDLQMPDGLKEHDPYLGDVEIYHHALDAALPYTLGDKSAGNLRVAVTFQGCHEVDPKICYPPFTQDLDLPLPGATGFATRGAISLPAAEPARHGSLDAALQSLRGKAGATDAANGSTVPATADATNAAARGDAGAGQSEEQILAGRIGRHDLAVVLLFFLGGLGLAFTPCVWPMIPILSGLIVGAGERIPATRAFLLSLTYVLASCIVFTLAGIVAGLAGANLSAWMQKPAILVAFAILFVLLALSMFGLYELQLPSAWQVRLTNLSNRQKAGSFVGVAVMGVLSALIVGPCVTPALGGAVLYIGQSHDPVFGGLALFALSFGMGAPLLVIGTAAGRLLPKAGAWMDVVKAVFGVAFLGVATWMLSRILEPRWTLALTGALLVGCAVFLGALTRPAADLSGWRRFGQALGLIALILGGCELVGSAAGSQNLLEPLAGVSGGAGAVSTSPAFRRVKSAGDVERAVAAAAASGRPAMLDFYADWCVSCKEMEAKTFSRPDVQRALSGFVLLRADVTANDAVDQALLKRYGLLGPPATLFFGRDGGEQRALRLVGYEDSSGFIDRLHKIAP